MPLKQCLGPGDSGCLHPGHRCTPKPTPGRPKRYADSIAPSARPSLQAMERCPLAVAESTRNFAHYWKHSSLARFALGLHRFPYSLADADPRGPESAGPSTADTTISYSTDGRSPGLACRTSDPRTRCGRLRWDAQVQVGVLRLQRQPHWAGWRHGKRCVIGNTDPAARSIPRFYSNLQRTVCWARRASWAADRRTT